MSTFHCHRCGRQSPPASNILQRPELASEIEAKVCAGCWHEWVGAEVMVINELQLNFMDPKAPEILEKNLREFLRLDEQPPEVPS